MVGGVVLSGLGLGRSLLGARKRDGMERVVDADGRGMSRGSIR